MDSIERNFFGLLVGLGRFVLKLSVVARISSINLPLQSIDKLKPISQLQEWLVRKFLQQKSIVWLCWMVKTKSIDMTAQIQDTISIEHQLYWLARSSNREGLFNPTDYGINPDPVSTAYNRGFYCSYIICDRRLLVMDVNISPNISDRLKFKHQMIEAILCGQSPKISESNSYIWQYRELFHPITYTGGLLVCNEMS